MALQLITAPTVEPLSLSEAKAHLRVEVNDDDSYIASLITAARHHCEDYCQRSFITQTWRMTADKFPNTCTSNGVQDYRDAQTFRLSRPPVISISSITYTNTAGDTTTLSSSSYRFDSQSEPARVEPAYGVSWPSAREMAGSVVVNYTAGYGASASYVPEPIKHAMRLLIGHWYEHREAVTLGQTPTSVPLGVESLLNPFRVMEYR